MFAIKNIYKSFGGLQALNAVSFQLEKGEVVGVIGPNGAGKTTLFNVINGLLSPDLGQVVFEGNDITGMPPHAICTRGIARTFQVAQPFRDMPVCDNVLTAALCRTDDVKEASLRALETLELCELAGKASVLAKNLNTIDQRRLELAKAMATRPTLLLLDEIMAGLTMKECDTAVNLVRSIQATGLSVLMVEHVMKAVMALCNRIVVLKQGAVLAEGTPTEITQNENVISAYLGRGNKENA